jgi:hypothetical protein
LNPSGSRGVETRSIGGDSFNSCWASNAGEDRRYSFS